MRMRWLVAIFLGLALLTGRVVPWAAGHVPPAFAGAHGDGQHGDGDKMGEGKHTGDGQLGDGDGLGEGKHLAKGHEK